VDHEHITFFITFRKEKDGVKGWCSSLGVIRPEWAWAKTKVQAEKLAKKLGVRYTVRGILCGGRFAGCNRKLGHVDKPEWLTNMAKYLLDPPARKVLKSAV
jgi:hypothetical protein